MKTSNFCHKTKSFFCFYIRIHYKKIFFKSFPTSSEPFFSKVEQQIYFIHSYFQQKFFKSNSPKGNRYSLLQQSRFTTHFPTCSIKMKSLLNFNHNSQILFTKVNHNFIFALWQNQRTSHQISPLSTRRYTLKYMYVYSTR